MGGGGERRRRRELSSVILYQQASIDPFLYTEIPLKSENTEDRRMETEDYKGTESSRACKRRSSEEEVCGDSVGIKVRVAGIEETRQ